MKTIALAALALLGAAPQDKETSVKLATLAPKDTSWYNIIRDMADAWKKAADGKVKFTIYPGGTMGDEPEMVKRMEAGQLHAAALTGVGLAEIAPEIMALQMPMLLQDYEELDYVMEKMAPKLEEALRKKGYTVLNWGDAGWVTFYGKEPIVTIDDLRKRKLFVWAGSSVEVEVWKKAGVQVVPLAATDIHPSLQSGLIDAFSTTPIAALSFQWFGHAKNMTGFKWAPLIGATVIKEKKWNSISEAAKPALLKAAKEAGDRFRTETRQLGDKSVEVMKEHGLKVHPVPPDVLAAWEKQARSAWPDIMGKSIPRESVAEVEKLRDEFRASRKKQ